VRRRAAPALPIVLLVERSDSLRDLLGTLLAEEGYHVLGAATRQAVFEQLRGAPRIDLVIADCGMPGMPAWDIVQEATWRHPGVACVRLVESRADALPVYGLDAATEAVLQRPISLAHLLAAMQRLLAGRAGRGLA
jgi:DNA-binding response OmpR family regulator